MSASKLRVLVPFAVVLLLTAVSCRWGEIRRFHPILRSSDGIPANAVLQLAGVSMGEGAAKDDEAAEALPEFAAVFLKEATARLVRGGANVLTSRAPVSPNAYVARLTVLSISGCGDGWFFSNLAEVSCIVTVNHADATVEIVEVHDRVDCRFNKQWPSELASNVAATAASYLLWREHRW